MTDLNRVMLIGRLGQDPDVRLSSGGTQVATLNVATTMKWKKDGEQKEKTEWTRVVAFNKLAEIAESYLQKGSRCYFEGRMQTRDYEKDGQKHYITEVVLEKMQMLDPKGGGAQNAPPEQKEPNQAPDNFDDDIPF